MTHFTSQEQYLRYLDSRGGLPEGFRVGTGELAFFPRERSLQTPLPMRLTLILLDEPSGDFAGVYTRNTFPGAPVLIGRQRLDGAQVRGVLINNKISNVRAPRGVEDAEELLSELGRLVGAPAGEFFPASTGIIGWSLPVPEMKAALPALVRGLHGGSCLDAARAVMTTDSYPKLKSLPVGRGTLLGFGKGAGMIEPNMATMLIFLLTDLAIPRDILRRCLSRAVERSFNCISVDGDQSTSDTALLLSSGRKPAVPEEEFQAALDKVCGDLAVEIVRNGEGTAHVIRVRVSGAPSFETAREAGKAVVNSPLVKTAVYGNDPNVGRILSAVGDYAGNRGLRTDPRAVRIRLGGEEIFRDGSFLLDGEKEKRLSAYLTSAMMDPEGKKFPPHDRTVDIDISLGMGDGEALVHGSDLSHEYIRENADYRS